MAVEKTLPKQLQADLDAAEAIQAQLNGEAPQVNTDPPTSQDAPQVQDDKPGATQEQPPAAKPAENFEAKYKVLEGKYRKEVPQLTESLRTANQQIQALTAQVQELAKPPEPKEDPLVTSKDEEAFGADLIDLARRVVREEISSVLKRVSTIERAVAAIARVSEKVDRIEEVNAQTAEERFWGDVNRLVPDWQEVDSDDRWIEFLELRAKGSAKTHRILAQEAIAAGNSEAIAELVQFWKDSSGITEQQSKEQQKQRELASQAQPGKSKTAATAQQPAEQGRIWTWSEYERVFTPNIAREYTPAQIAAMQADAEQAYLEGRIR